MKIEVTNGCTAFSFRVNDKPIDDLSEGALLDTLFRATSKVLTKRSLTESDRYAIQELIRDIVESFPDEYQSDDEPCDQCVDYVEYYKMEV